MENFAQHDAPVAYLNGEYLPFNEVRLPVYDLAIMQGASVTERLRTIRHRPYQIDEHLSRLQESLRLVNWANVPSLAPLPEVITQLCEQNSNLLKPGEELAIVVFISAGQAVGDSNGLESLSKPTSCLYTAKLPMARWVEGYINGIELFIPEIRQIPRTTFDPRIKMRSRLHWQLADQLAKDYQPDAMAILLDEHDHLTETSSGNLMLVRDGVVYTPCADATLNGISRQNVVENCRELGVEVVFRNLTALDLYQAEEAFLTSSTYCILPVAALNGQKIGSAVPGSLTKKLIQAWSECIGLNFVDQAMDSKL